MTKNIIIKTSVQKRFDSFMVHGRVLFFSAPCGFGKTVLADALLRGRNVLRQSAADPDCAIPPSAQDWDILVIDDLQLMQEEAGQQALCELIRSSPERHFVLLSRGVPPGCLTAFQYTGLMTVLEADDLLFDAGDVRRTIMVLRECFAERGLTRFLPNMDAMLCRIDMHTGDLDAADAGGVLHAFPRTQPCSRRGADAHGTANSPSALCGQIQHRDCTEHGREAAHGEDPRQPHSRQAGREAPGGSQDRREEAAFSAGRPVKKHPADVGFPYKSKTIF